MVAAQDPHPQRGRRRRAAQPRPLVAGGGAHLAVGDPRVAEPDAAEQRVVAATSPPSLRQLARSVAARAGRRAASR